MQQVQKMSCLNEAPLAINFEVQYLDTSTGEWIPIPGTNSSNFPAGQQRTIDLSTVTFPYNALLRPYVASKEGSVILVPDTYVMYANNGRIATYIAEMPLTGSITLTEETTLAR